MPSPPRPRRSDPPHETLSPPYPDSSTSSSSPRHSASSSRVRTSTMPPSSPTAGQSTHAHHPHHHHHHHHHSSHHHSSSHHNHHHHSSSHHRPPTSNPDAVQVVRSRRGRQARPSHLSAAMHRAVRRFARSVGAPTVVEPAGFRDFRGWLARLSSTDSRPLWDQLLGALARDVSCDITSMHALKEDIVREIVKCVVIPRPDESAKLVSTNAGRQASRPRSGTTLMVVLEQQLARVEGKLATLVVDAGGSGAGDDRGGASGDDGGRGGGDSSGHLPYSGHGSSSASGSGSGWGSGRQRSISGQRASADMLPSVSDILGERRASPRTSLPSFRELDASLKKNGTHHSHR